jgi:rfaE bifunctional protein nucleotidyltransferase chain/domain
MYNVGMFCDVPTSVLLTLSYSDQFSFPLKLEEVWLRLVGSQKVSQKEVEEALHFLIENDVVASDGDFFWLKDRADGQALAQRRGELARIATAKQSQLAPLLDFARWWPGFEGIWLTGSVAVANADANADIDLMIVTRHNMLWMTRLAVLLWSSLHGKRRNWRPAVEQLPEDADSWCFNLWLSSNRLAMPRENRSLYTAYEILQMVPVFERNAVHTRFIAENLWVKKFLPNFLAREVAAGKGPRQSFYSFRWLTWWPCTISMHGLELLAYLLQRIYMLPHLRTERVGFGYAFFHPRPTSKLVNSKWLEVLERVRVGLSAAAARRRRQKIVLATGVFDIFHQEHLSFLQKAKKAGDFLMVGVEADARVRQMKGENRPINSLDHRIKTLQNLGFIDLVFALPEQFDRPADHEALIARIRPAILAVSSHTAHLEKKRALLSKYGGTVKVVHQHNPAISTSILLEQKK